MKRVDHNQNHQNRPIAVIARWWQRADVGTDLNRIFVLLLVALGTGFIFNTIFIWPKQYPSSANPPHFELRRISVQSAYQLAKRQQAVIVDVRPPEPYAHRHITGAVNLPLSRFDDHYPDFASQVDKSQTVILYCAPGCSLYEEVATKLQQRGYQHVNVMPEGPEVWEDAGYPVTSADDTHRTEDEWK